MSTPSPANYVIVETGFVPESLLPQHGSYADMAQHMLAPWLPQATFVHRHAVLEDDLGQLQDYAGIVIMGSEFSVLDADNWIARLSEFVVQAAAAQIPLVGICFGHQLIAQALGGTVASSAWQVGVKAYQSSDLHASDATTDWPAVAYHQDQVTQLPANCEVWLSHADCPYAGLLYQQHPACSVQSHPEFSRQFALDLFAYTRGGDLSAEQTNAAIASLNTPLDTRRYAEQFARTLSGQTVLTSDDPCLTH